MPTRSRSRTLFVITAALVLFALAACGSDADDKTSSGDNEPLSDQSGNDYGSSDGGDGGDGGGEAEEYVVVAEDFSLTDLTVGPGEEFTLDNRGSSTHTLTADDGSFDTGRVDAGSVSDPLTPPDEPGEYAFHCEIHESMTATLTVEG